jgi:hypothetical protein
MDTGQAAASRLSFTVPAPAAISRASLSSPLILVPGKKAEFVKMARTKKEEKETASIIRFYPFLPKNCAPLLDDLPPDVDKVWVLLPVNYGAGQPSEADLDVKLVRADDGEEIPVTWSVLDSRKAEPATVFLFIEIAVPGLKPGAHRLEFSVTDAKFGTKTSVNASLVKK